MLTMGCDNSHQEAQAGHADRDSARAVDGDAVWVEAVLEMGREIFVARCCGVEGQRLCRGDQERALSVIWRNGSGGRS